MQNRHLITPKQSVLWFLGLLVLSVIGLSAISPAMALSGALSTVAASASLSVTQNTDSPAIPTDVTTNQCYIVIGQNVQTASSSLILAAREIQRYIYLRTGKLLTITTLQPSRTDIIILTTDATLSPQQYRLKTVIVAHHKTLRITGGSPLAVLYGAYTLAKKLGVRFYMHGDVIPDKQIPLNLPTLNETHKPLFNLRGVQPFHDFTEGPDWWTLNDYKAYMSQLVKMRMNFMGFHCYPEGGVGPEPLVWIGLPEDVNPDGTVKSSYPSRWASTSGGSWGYASTATSDFAAGASLLFPADDYGSPVTNGYRPIPKTPQQCNAVFNRAGHFLNNAFRFGHQLGIKFCLGTETPLAIPKDLQNHLEQKGMNPKDPAVISKLYEGIFTRIVRSFPLDYYWLWTPESWTWSGTKQSAVTATVHDIKQALQAIKTTHSPFLLATCGWVLGPQRDRSLFDKILPKTSPISCINRQVGFSPVEPGFARVKNRPQWAIPWLEDDSALIIPQLWAGRMRRDAADAYAYGCTGLMGIHWRTKVLAPNIASLAQAAWNQPWNPHLGQRLTSLSQQNDVYIGGTTASYHNPIAGTSEDYIYQTCRYNLMAYHIKVPNGIYKVTLNFCEVAYGQPGKRVFGVKIQGRDVIKSLDVFKRVGKNTALDVTLPDIKVTNEQLNIEFVKQVEFPFIAGIVIEGTTQKVNQLAGKKYIRKINCGGGACGDYEADLTPESNVMPWFNTRDLPIDDFYRDWASHSFGSKVSLPLAKLFTSLDGGPGKNYNKNQTRLPRPANWLAGPGGIPANRTPWTQEQKKYTFVKKMAALRKQVKGPGNLARFDYWLNQFRYLRQVGKLGCQRGQLDIIMQQLKKQKRPDLKKSLAQKALKIRIEMARSWEQMMTYLLAAVDTTGGMGTIANLEQHVRRNNRNPAMRCLDYYDKTLAAALGQKLPEQIHPTTRYLGKARLIVPTVRTQLQRGESLTLKIIILDNNRPKSSAIYFRTMGRGYWHHLKLKHINRGVYTVTLPPAGNDTLEYYIRVVLKNGTSLQWPPSAPKLNQTIVTIPNPQ